MFTKFIQIIGFIALFGATTLSAQSPETIGIAQENEQLSQKLAVAYIHNKDVAKTIERLEDQQDKLKGAVHDPEINNLLNFLQLCLENIKKASTEPHSAENAELISDLSGSIREGSRYITLALQGAR
jgi:hypothetical protein